MIKVIPKNKTPHKKLFCDWTNKKKYFILFGMLNFYVRQGMVADKVNEVISLK